MIGSKYSELMDKKWLKDMRMEYSKAEIAKFLGCGTATVDYWIKKHNLFLSLKDWRKRERYRLRMSKALEGNKNGLGQKFPLAIRQRWSIERIGIGNPNYKGVIRTASNRTCLPSWMRLARKIRKRDNYTCNVCDKKPSYDVHHIVPYNHSKDDSETNLITLCRSCHRKVESKLCFA